MRGLLLLLLLTVSSPLLYGQGSQDSLVVDPNYLEDQFYVGLTYNLLLNRPEGVTQRSLSYGLMGGFIKDIPFNRRRNVGIGIGLGYAVNSYYSNLGVTETDGGYEYTILDSDVDFKRSKVETHLIEVPLEFRWRNSTATSYKFWRIYTGVKFAYAFGSRSKYVTDAYKDSFYNQDVQDFQYGIIFNFGYQTFNIHAYYALNQLFEKGTVTTDGQDVEFAPLRIGLIFYIL